MYKSTDVRTAIMLRDTTKGSETVPYYRGGKFDNAAKSPAYSSNYMVNAPEMYLIQAEALLQKGDLDGSRKALLVVAGRDVSIKAVGDLPQTKDALYSFIKDERARELFQEGFRLWDLRRWDTSAEVYAINAPKVEYRAIRSPTLFTPSPQTRSIPVPVRLRRRAGQTPCRRSSASESLCTAPPDMPCSICGGACFYGEGRERC